MATESVGEQIRTVLCFAAHPDDIDFGAAGTIASWTARGVSVTYCIMTDGDAGGFSEDHRADIVERRREEQRNAARLVGVRDVQFLGEPDGNLQPTAEVIREVVRQIRRVRPDVVLSMHPERSWERIQKSHPDHLACGEAVTQAVYPAAENPYAFPELLAEGLEAFKVPWLWFYGSPARLENHSVDITGFEDRKLEAIRFHASQHPDLARMDSRVRGMLLANAERVGLPAGHSAELFHAVPVNTEQTIAGF